MVGVVVVVRCLCVVAYSCILIDAISKLTPTTAASGASADQVAAAGGVCYSP